MYGPEKQSYLLRVQLSILGHATNNKEEGRGLKREGRLIIFFHRKGGGTCLR